MFKDFDRWKKKCIVSMLSLCILGGSFTAGTVPVSVYGAGQPAATTQAAATTQQPAASSEKPAATTQQPATASEKPAATTQQPAASSEQPAATQQTTGATKKTTQASQQTTEAEEPETKEERALKAAGLTKKDITYRIMLDPGHGGDDSGADGVNSSEKRLNLLIGLYLKEALEEYENVKVGMTRKDDTFVPLHDRVKMADEKDCDLVISLHNDMWDSGLPYDNGSSVLVAKKGSYRDELRVQEERLARNILTELESVGLVNRGLVRKKSDRVPEYEDGSLGDYHAIIRDGIRRGIPSILVEHAFCDSEHDYDNFLRSEESLKKLAQADARGVARFLQLRKKGTGETIPAVSMKGKKQQCTADKSAYYTLARKRYNNKLYYKALDEAPDQPVYEEEEVSSGELDELEQKKQKAAMEVKAAQAKQAAIDKKNKEAEKKLPTVIFICLGLFAAVIIIREFEFGFHIEIRAKKRDKYSKWQNWKMRYRMD